MELAQRIKGMALNNTQQGNTAKLNSYGQQKTNNNQEHRQVTERKWRPRHPNYYEEPK